MAAINFHKQFVSLIESGKKGQNLKFRIGCKKALKTLIEEYGNEIK